MDVKGTNWSQYRRNALYILKVVRNWGKAGYSKSHIQLGYPWLIYSLPLLKQGCPKGPQQVGGDNESLGTKSGHRLVM